MWKSVLVIFSLGVVVSLSGCSGDDGDDEPEGGADVILNALKRDACLEAIQSDFVALGCHECADLTREQLQERFPQQFQLIQSQHAELSNVPAAAAPIASTGADALATCDHDP